MIRKIQSVNVEVYVESNGGNLYNFVIGVQNTRTGGYDMVRLNSLSIESLNELVEVLSKLLPRNING